MTDTINGTHGDDNTPCSIFTYEGDGGTWYVVEGSADIALTYEELADGCDVEQVEDVATITWSDPINSETELKEAAEF